METKICSKCKEKKPVERFSKNKRLKDGLHSHCKDCMKKRHHDWREKNPEKAREKSQRANYKWKKKHPGKISEASRKHKQKKRKEMEFWLKLNNAKD